MEAQDTDQLLAAATSSHQQQLLEATPPTVSDDAPTVDMVTPTTVAWRAPSDLARQQMQPIDVCECRLGDVHIDPKTRLRTATMYVHADSVGIVIGKHGRQLEALVKYTGDKSSITHTGGGVFEIKAATSQAIGRLRLKAQDTIKSVHLAKKPTLRRQQRQLPNGVRTGRKSAPPSSSSNAVAGGFAALAGSDSDDNE